MNTVIHSPEMQKGFLNHLMTTYPLLQLAPLLEHPFIDVGIIVGFYPGIMAVSL